MKNLLKSIGWAVLIVGLALSLAFGFNVSGLCEGRAIELQKFKYSTNDR